MMFFPSLSPAKLIAVSLGFFFSCNLLFVTALSYFPATTDPWSDPSEEQIHNQFFKSSLFEFTSLTPTDLAIIGENPDRTSNNFTHMYVRISTTLANTFLLTFPFPTWLSNLIFHISVEKTRFVFHEWAALWGFFYVIPSPTGFYPNQATKVKHGFLPWDGFIAQLSNFLPYHKHATQLCKSRGRNGEIRAVTADILTWGSGTYSTQTQLEDLPLHEVFAFLIVTSLNL